MRERGISWGYCALPEAEEEGFWVTTLVVGNAEEGTRLAMKAVMHGGRKEVGSD